MVLRFGGTAQRMALFVARIPPKMTFESWGLCLSTLQRVCAGAAWVHTEGTPQLFPHSCFPHWAEWVSVSGVSLRRIVCHVTICREESEELSGSLKTANGAFMSWFRCALMLFFSSLDIMRAAENIQTWFFRIWEGAVKTQPAQPRSIAMLCIIINEVQAVAYWMVLLSVPFSVTSWNPLWFKLLPFLPFVSWPLERATLVIITCLFFFFFLSFFFVFVGHSMKPIVLVSYIDLCLLS